MPVCFGHGIPGCQNNADVGFSGFRFRGIPFRQTHGDRRFRVEQARCKLKSLYLSIQ